MTGVGGHAGRNAMRLSAVPFERQDDPASCGAAVLAMIYRSFGIERRQDEIWPAIATQSSRGRRCARAQSLVMDARRCGLDGLVVQARDPWVILERCLDQSVRVILNHATDEASGAGHFSVLRALTPGSIVVHDPYVGPDRTLARDEFLRLWNPRSSRREILDQVLIAISDTPSGVGPCPLCSVLAGDEFTCPNCGRAVVLQPLAVLRCLTDWCPMRNWELVFCPYCDQHWSDGLSSARVRAAATPPAGETGGESP
jgi:hypothetical protein